MSTIREIFGMRVPTPWALKRVVECSNPDLMMGVELEIENCDHDQDWYQERTGKLGWTTTVDNSLRGVNVTTGGNQGVTGAAFEFISKPMKASTLLFSMEEFFKVTKFDDKNYTDRCSVHVHVNCTDLTPEQVSSVALVYSVVEDILFRFVGADRENNIYCMPWSQCRMNHDMVDRITTNVDGTSRRWQKYTALNLIPLRGQGTIEFRQMHGTADMKKLTTWINLIGCIFKYGTTTELTELIKEIKSLNSTSEYEVFFDRVLGGYLPYDNEYRATLEGGIISAKYGLINWKKTSKVQKDADATAPQMILDDIEDNAAEAQAAPMDWRIEPPSPNRFIPWPPIGTTVSLATLNQRERTYITTAWRGGLWRVDNGDILITDVEPVNAAPTPQPPPRRPLRPAGPGRAQIVNAAVERVAGPGPEIVAALARIRARQAELDHVNNQEGEF